MIKSTMLTLLLASVPVTAHAKGTTTRIVIASPELASPIEIAGNVSLFHVWAGPGTSSNERQSLIVDWAAGPVEPPKSPALYTVSFQTTRSNPGTYIVLYAIEPSTRKGFVFIPGKDHSAYRDNTWLILRGVEGRWFRAWSEWEKRANPLILNAPKAR